MRAHLVVEDRRGQLIYRGNASDVEITNFELRYREMSTEDKTQWPDVTIRVEVLGRLEITPAARDDDGRQLRLQEASHG